MTDQLFSRDEFVAFADWFCRITPDSTYSQKMEALALAVAVREFVKKKLETPMTITKEQQEQMLEAAKPLIEWMNKNCHPHCTARVDLDTVELAEGIATITKTGAGVMFRTLQP